jgi:hypothetical protein
MADEPVQLREYEVEVRPGWKTTMQLSDEDAERLGVKDSATSARAADEPKSRSAANKSRNADNK